MTDDAAPARLLKVLRPPVEIGRRTERIILLVGAAALFAGYDINLFGLATVQIQQSLNIAENRRVSLVLFDSTKAPGQGSALYVAADAEQAEGSTFDDALSVYNTRSVERGLTEWTPATLREPAKHRLYVAVAREAFVLDDHDERIRLAPS